MPKQRLPRPEPETPPARPALAADRPRSWLLEREVEIKYRPPMLAALQSKVAAVAAAARGTAPLGPHCGQPMRCQDTRPVSWLARGTAPACPHCGQPMRCQDTRPVSWLARGGRLHASVSRYGCPPCRYECRPLLDPLGVEAGRISGAPARWLALPATVAPYPLAARLAELLLGVTISPMGIWRVAQRLGEAAAHHTEALSRYHANSRSAGAPPRRRSPGRSVGSGWPQLGNAGAFSTVSPQGRGNIAAVESAHKRVTQARFRQAGMRWSEAGARRLSALRLLWLNDNWARLDRLRMVSLA